MPDESSARSILTSASTAASLTSAGNWIERRGFAGRRRRRRPLFHERDSSQNQGRGRRSE